MSFEFDNFKLLIFVYNQSSWVLERGLMQEAIPASQCSDFYFCKMLKIYGGLIGEIDWLSSCPPLYLDLCFSLIDVVLSSSILIVLPKVFSFTWGAVLEKSHDRSVSSGHCIIPFRPSYRGLYHLLLYDCRQVI